MLVLNNQGLVAFTGPVTADDLVKTCLNQNNDWNLESLWVAHVDERCCCTHFKRYRGSVDEVDLPVRDIIGDVGRLGSEGLVMAHNHPSGNPIPSDADVNATRRLACAAETIGTVVLDHLIFAKSGQYSSLRRMGLL